ncbi:hypothetical protein [Chitinophaga flava]|uniref:Uncharacterized protein n=1 Tax=Chitinophaga flava TaxID=2259036 RepID=A0A365XYY8_9BACT|nr:hypothetical protein [Chitinophaga flava]RBL91596.1 hypothetical protein DF182_02985 [Chitinophaga flava]
MYSIFTAAVQCILRWYPQKAIRLFNFNLTLLVILFALGTLLGCGVIIVATSIWPYTESLSDAFTSSRSLVHFKLAIVVRGVITIGTGLYALYLPQLEKLETPPTIADFIQSVSTRSLNFFFLCVMGYCVLMTVTFNGIFAPLYNFDHQLAPEASKWRQYVDTVFQEGFWLLSCVLAFFIVTHHHSEKAGEFNSRRYKPAKGAVLLLSIIAWAFFSKLEGYNWYVYYPFTLLVKASLAPYLFNNTLSLLVMAYLLPALAGISGYSFAHHQQPAEQKQSDTPALEEA